MNEDDIKTHFKNVTRARCEYETLKKQYEMTLLKLKYSKEYMIYKTIKEKEEHAKLEAEELMWRVHDANQKLQYFECKKELDELDMYYFDTECCCCEGKE